MSYCGSDGHGSTRFLTDTNGNISDTYTFDAYGLLIASTGPSTPNNYLYCGQQFDSDLGLYYLRARYYKPDSGRFWTMDSYDGSSEDPLSLHKYLYTEDDPVDMDDPAGKDAMVVQQWGWLGHTSFVLSNPKDGGVRVYHYFASGHRQGANWSSSVQGVAYDKEYIWDRDYPSFGVYLNELATEQPSFGRQDLYTYGLGYSVDVLAYAYGTKQDDQRLFDELNSEEISQTVNGYYSFVMGHTCLEASWRWFHEYAGTDAPMPAYLRSSSILDLSTEGAKHIQLPQLMYVTALAKMPTIESVEVNSFGVGDSFGF